MRQCVHERVRDQGSFAAVTLLLPLLLMLCLLLLMLYLLLQACILADASLDEAKTASSTRLDRTNSFRTLIDDWRSGSGLCEARLPAGLYALSLGTFNSPAQLTQTLLCSIEEQRTSFAEERDTNAAAIERSSHTLQCRRTARPEHVRGTKLVENRRNIDGGWWTCERKTPRLEDRLFNIP